MVLFVLCNRALTRTQLEYYGEMPMWLFLRDVLAPTCGLDCVDGTVLAKVHTPELRVVFNNDLRGKQLKTIIDDWSVLVVSPWPQDSITIRSLEGNALPP
jgi:hypothetical protein